MPSSPSIATPRSGKPGDSHDRDLYLPPVGGGRPAEARLGAHRRKRPRAPRATRGLAGAAPTLPRRARLPTRPLPRPPHGRYGYADLSPGEAPLFVLQRRPHLGLPAVDRHATLRRAELHAGDAGLGSRDRLPLS